MRRALTGVVGVAAALAVAVPVFGLAGGEEADLETTSWERAVLLRDDRGPGGTLVVMYRNVNGEDRARRLTMTLQSPVAVVGVSMEKVGGPIKDIPGSSCAKARIERLPPALASGSLLLDGQDEATGVSDYGFVVPPLRECRTLPLDVKQAKPAARPTFRVGARLIYAEVVRGGDPALLLVHDRGDTRGSPEVELTPGSPPRVRLEVTVASRRKPTLKLGCVELPGRFDVEARRLVDETTSKRITENLGGEPATELRDFGLRRSECLRAVRR